VRFDDCARHLRRRVNVELELTLPAVDHTLETATVSQSVNHANGFSVHGIFFLCYSTGNIFGSLKIWKMLTKGMALVLRFGDF
jgi:hypothetical protein